MRDSVALTDRLEEEVRSQPSARASKERVRAWLRHRQRNRLPLPDRAQMARELGMLEAGAQINYP